MIVKRTFLVVITQIFITHVVFGTTAPTPTLSPTRGLAATTATAPFRHLVTGMGQFAHRPARPWFFFEKNPGAHPIDDPTLPGQHLHRRLVRFRVFSAYAPLIYR
jgi:hypothetical protein